MFAYKRLRMSVCNNVYKKASVTEIGWPRTWAISEKKSFYPCRILWMRVYILGTMLFNLVDVLMSYNRKAMREKPNKQQEIFDLNVIWFAVIAPQMELHFVECIFSCCVSNFWCHFVLFVVLYIHTTVHAIIFALKEQVTF